VVDKAITLIEGFLSEMAFHEKAGPGQVDFALPFLKFPFPSWREGVQSGPERSRARSVRRSEPLTARTDLSPFRQEGNGAVVLDFLSFLGSCFAPQPKAVATLPSALFDERFVSLGASWVFSLQPVLPIVCRPLFHLAMEVGPGH
jgi:hypothetical protein